MPLRRDVDDRRRTEMNVAMTSLSYFSPRLTAAVLKYN